MPSELANMISVIAGQERVGVGQLPCCLPRRMICPGAEVVAFEGTDRKGQWMASITSADKRGKCLREDNKVRVEDQAVHEWYRFVLSYPPHLVRDYLARFAADERQTVLDPFCGTGTTLVECKKLGIPSIGMEPNPVACLASKVKTTWDVSPEGLMRHARGVADIAAEKMGASGAGDAGGFPLFESGKTASQLRNVAPEAFALLLKGSISPVPLHKTLILIEALEENADVRFAGHEKLALAKALVTDIGNLHFGPEVGVGAAKPDAPVLSVWLDNVRRMADDLKEVRGKAHVPATVHQADSRLLASSIKPDSVDIVITSPPYPNEKEYTRTTRLESVLLGFIRDKADLRALKGNLVRSNTRSVYKNDDDDLLVAGNGEIQRIAAAIEKRRIELGKTSGFERMYARVTKLYFGGMARHLAELRKVLRPGARLAYVVGDQASYLRVMIRTGNILAGIAETLGYEVTGIDLFRTRLATATKEQLREEVVLLRWRGKDS
jgi:DNA modification methylase